MTKKLHTIIYAALFSLIFSFGSAKALFSQEAKPAIKIQPSEYAPPMEDEVTGQVLSEGEALTITATGKQKEYVIPIDRFRVKPGTDYRVRYQLRPGELEEAASIYVLIREHRSMESGPVPPYQKESVRVRELPTGSAQEWKERELRFTTGEETHALSGSLVFVKLKGTVSLSALEVWEAAAYEDYLQEQKGRKKLRATEEYQKVLAELHAQAAARVPLTPRPLVFSRAQIKYTLGRNYYHEWNDRPLLVNRDYRVPSPYMAPIPGYKRTLSEVRKYGIDGLAFFPGTKDRMSLFKAHAEAGVTDIGLLPEFFEGGNVAGEDDTRVEALRHALKSPFVPRLDGKVLITSYGAGAKSPEQWKQTLAELRKYVGDTFVFLTSLTEASSFHKKYFISGDPIPAAEIEEVKAHLRAYLDVTDGIYFNYPPALHLNHMFDDAYYREILIPIMKSVLSEPPYRKKYLGLSAYKSHMHPERGNNLWQDGTRTLRSSFEAAMDARPDVIILPEWDEQNENTSWRPTVYGSRTNQRIMHYYMSKIKGEDPTPIPNDDVEVPNFVFSSRKIASLGENLMFELLNIPDGTQGEYSVQLTLKDIAGNILKVYDPVSFDATKMQEHRLYFATESAPQARALIPVLAVRGYKNQERTFEYGLHATQVRATWNWDYLYVNQPLREILHPVSAAIQWEKSSQNDGSLILTGSVTAPEELNLVEVLGDDDEVYTVDLQDEFFRNDPDRELMVIEYRSPHSKSLKIKGSISLRNATADWFANNNILHQEKSQEHLNQQTMNLETAASEHQRYIYLAISKENIAEGEIIFDFDKAKFTLPLAKVKEKGMIARGFDEGLHISLRTYHRQIDMPRPLRSKSTSFRVKVWPEIASEQYHLRLTSMNGKLYRTQPLPLQGSNDSEMQTLRIYSEEKKKGIDVQVPKNQIPDLKYEFDPERGAVLLTNAGRPFWATLGGFSNTTTGRGAYAAVFGKGNFPENVTRTAPQWVVEDGEPALEFDGNSTYLELPREALPSRNAYTLSLEVKPDSDKDQGILANGTSGRQGGLLLEIRGGTLHASFRDSERKLHGINTQLPVPAGRWSKIRVSYDFEKLKITVNGESTILPSTLPPNSIGIGFTEIGMAWNKPWFSGRMRGLHIVHNVNA